MDLPMPYRYLVFLEFALAVPTFLSLWFVPAPYGRYTRRGFGPTIPARLGWIAMESPAPLFFAAVYFAGPNSAAAAPLALLGLWQVHYLYRAFLYPLQIREGSRRMPVLVALLAVCFNLLNAWINARWVSALGSYPASWLSDPRFVAGAALFLGGFALNVTSDRALRRLRAPGETGYRIPRGGAFEWVSCPNYLGEILEWTGWAFATWSLAGAAFAVYTAANLAPRAFAHHAWYRRQFSDYPAERRALIPFVG
ncbi:MAG TPA: methyltransferase [Anaeromyxobacteraceae bacterium]|nr:methyltransferase [Anaeromyxobacteraceae bacterium]